MTKTTCTCTHITTYNVNENHRYKQVCIIHACGNHCLRVFFANGYILAMFLFKSPLKGVIFFVKFHTHLHTHTQTHTDAFTHTHTYIHTHTCTHAQTCDTLVSFFLATLFQVLSCVAMSRIHKVTAWQDTE